MFTNITDAQNVIARCRMRFDKPQIGDGIKLLAEETQAWVNEANREGMRAVRLQEENTALKAKLAHDPARPVRWHLAAGGMVRGEGMRFISLFSGIGGFDLGLERAGMISDSVVEIDKNCQSVLRQHFPNAKLFDDVKKVGKDTHEPKTIDLICGGFPCQDVSVAGKRAGLAGERSGLWFEFARVVDELEPRWVVIENVPGLLSSNKGKDFAAIVQWLAERGYGVSWRILDAQYFGVPQRRRRVFIVASLGNGRSAQVLFESEGVSGNTKTKRQAGKVAPTLFANGAGTSRVASAGSESEFCTPVAKPIASGEHGSRRDLDNDNYVLQRAVSALQERDWKGVGSTIDDKLIAFTPRRTHINPMLDVSPTQNAGGGGMGANAIAWIERGYNPNGGEGVLESPELSLCLDNFRVPRVGVRRLTPTECARLQGFPDDWNSWLSDSVCYRQFGNAVAVPVVEWLGRIIVTVDANHMEVKR